MDLGDTHSVSTQRVFHILRGFVQEFSNRSEVSHLVEVVESETVHNARRQLDSVSLNQKPERFVEETLVEPILDALGYEVRFRPENYPKWSDSTPDFTVVNFDAETEYGEPSMRAGCAVIGEVKPLNNIGEANSEMKDYLDEDAGKDALGIATDGLNWKVRFQPRGGPSYKILEMNLTTPVIELSREYKENENYDNNRVRDLIERENVDKMKKSNLEDALVG